MISLHGPTGPPIIRVLILELTHTTWLKRLKDRSVRKTKMIERLVTVLEKISNIPNSTNSSLIQEFHQFIVDNRKSVAMRRTTILRHSFTSHRSLRPAHCILLRVISILMKRQTWQLPYQGPLLVMLLIRCKLVVWLHVYVLLSVDIRQ